MYPCSFGVYLILSVYAVSVCVPGTHAYTELVVQRDPWWEYYLRKHVQVHVQGYPMVDWYLHVLPGTCTTHVIPWNYRFLRIPHRIGGFSGFPIELEVSRGFP